MGSRPVAITLALALASGGCRQVFGLEDPVEIRDSAPSDIAVDMASDDATLCYGTGLITACFSSPPTGTLVLNAPINTAIDIRCQAVLPGVCVIAASQVTIEGTVVATGALPLVLVGAMRIDVNGTLDVSSRQLSPGEQLGAGEASGAAACGSPTPGGNDNLGAGGGAGGSFRGRGGVGASGRDGGGGPAGIASNAIAAPTQLRGGCRGSNGGSGGTVAGVGGHGGGAVYLISGTQISVAGVINASGEGGFGGQQYSGGGGGGSGGFIGLDAPSVVVSGIVFANGGGGGEGGGVSNAGNPGTSGIDATVRAPGGSGNTNGGDGGRGSQGLYLDGEGALSASNGGGAGGGAAGFIRVYPLQILGGTISPAPM